MSGVDGNGDRADTACRSADIEFGDTGNPAVHYELAAVPDEVPFHVGQLKVLDENSHFEVQVDEVIVHPEMGKLFSIVVDAGDFLDAVLDTTTFQFKMDYREVGTDEWSVLDVDLANPLFGAFFASVTLQPTSEGLNLAYITQGADIKTCRLQPRVGDTVLLRDWLPMTDYEYRIRPYVKSGFASLVGDYNYRLYHSGE